MRRFNLFDAAVLGFLVVLIPVAVGLRQLFRAPTPTVTSRAPDMVLPAFVTTVPVAMDTVSTLAMPPEARA